MGQAIQAYHEVPVTYWKYLGYKSKSNREKFKYQKLSDRFILIFIYISFQI